ncbi:MAG: radical SAM family heme chaperone HemW [Hyphomicrobium sp.]
MTSAASQEPGFGVYVHWPFCAQKCPYCDFNSHVRFGGWDEARFLAAYVQELKDAAERTGPRTVQSVFFGGGTPSLMQPATVAGIVDAIARFWLLAPDAEITLEANPGSVEAARFRGYRDAGVNRVSMGLQSLDDAELKKLGRIHTVAEATAAWGIARATFERVSFDLIYARPGQTLDVWRAELGEALNLAADHLSLYQLTIEPDTPYAGLHAAGKLIIPEDDAAAALYEITQDMTTARGLQAYEISNHARPGAESRHNLLYWRYGEYVGVGPGAHGRLMTPGGRVATVAEKHPETWLGRVQSDGHGLVETTALSPAEEADEMLLMGLRLVEGVDLDRVAAMGGVAPSAAVIEDLIGHGMIDWVSDAADGDWRENELNAIGACIAPGLAPTSERSRAAPFYGTSGRRIRATPRGRFVLNAIVAALAASFQPVPGRAGRVDITANAP